MGQALLRYVTLRYSYEHFANLFGINVSYPHFLLQFCYNTLKYMRINYAVHR